MCNNKKADFFGLAWLTYDFPIEKRICVDIRDISKNASCEKM